MFDGSALCLIDICSFLAAQCTFDRCDSVLMLCCGTLETKAIEWGKGIFSATERIMGVCGWDACDCGCMCYSNVTSLLLRLCGREC